MCPFVDSSVPIAWYGISIFASTVTSLVPVLVMTEKNAKEEYP